MKSTLLTIVPNFIHAKTSYAFINGVTELNFSKQKLITFSKCGVTRGISLFHAKDKTISRDNTNQFSRQYFDNSSTSQLYSSTSDMRQTLVEKDLPTPYFLSEQIIKKSRFIGVAKHCTSWDDAKTFIKTIRAEHPKSRHICYGLVTGRNPISERCSDDGEPTGTAGVPILGAIRGEGLSDTLCIVIRYYGGVKLGAGGLIRAYGGTARLVLRDSEKIILVPKSTIRFSTPSMNAGKIYQMANKYGGEINGETYTDTGNIEVTIVCETEFLEAFSQDVSDATKGNITYLDQ
mmetsp:Transcript_195/g.297  ORF Transcript_195/g.297 Transcript_195/m.297 type:complete len:291 (-) Transcript_195:44-916(-)